MKCQEARLQPFSNLGTKFNTTGGREILECCEYAFQQSVKRHNLNLFQISGPNLIQQKGGKYSLIMSKSFFNDFSWKTAFMTDHGVNLNYTVTIVRYREVQNICGQINWRTDRRRGLPLGRKLSQFFLFFLFGPAGKTLVFSGK
jgi:hypothetical protein